MERKITDFFTANAFKWIIIFTFLCFSFSACKKDVHVKEVTLNYNSYNLAPGETVTLIATVKPQNADNKNITWLSSDTAVATVSNNGLVTAIREGDVTITVTTQDGNKTARCDINVNFLLRIVQWSDPQLGFKVEYQAGIEQLRRSVSLINELRPDAVLITGDMVHFPERDDYINAFLGAISQINKSIPVLMTPGNHDICSPVTVEALQRYRSLFGDDLQTMERKGFSIISANALLLFKVDEVPPEERSHHARRVQEALQNAKSKNQPIITMTHYPPFEVEEHYELRNLFVENGTFIWLSGHWHMPWKHTYYHPGGTIDVLVGESTGSNDYGFPLGFRLLTIHQDKSYDWDYVSTN
jgi:predicted phosphohydrolase